MIYEITFCILVCCSVWVMEDIDKHSFSYLYCVFTLLWLSCFQCVVCMYIRLFFSVCCFVVVMDKTNFVNLSCPYLGVDIFPPSLSYFQCVVCMLSKLDSSRTTTGCFICVTDYIDKSSCSYLCVVCFVLYHFLIFSLSFESKAHYIVIGITLRCIYGWCKILPNLLALICVLISLSSIIFLLNFSSVSFASKVNRIVFIFTVSCFIWVMQKDAEPSFSYLCVACSNIPLSLPSLFTG